MGPAPPACHRATTRLSGRAGAAGGADSWAVAGGVSGLRVDTVLAGRYRLRRLLGAGGMSMVWQAYDRVLERAVAIKVLATDRAGEPAFRQRVRAEARAAAKLVHPHVVNVYDYAETIGPDGAVLPFVVMEMVDGQSLEQRLAAGPLEWPLAVRIAAQTAGALAAAHERGVVHRDVTAGNVILTGTGAKVVDFGISAAIGDRDTEPGTTQLLGTPAYLAPERLGGLPVAPAADVYSLGVLLHTMLAGTTPFDGDTTTAVTRAHWYRPPAPLPPIAGLPPEVDRLRRHCLAKRARDRPTAADLAAALTALPVPDTLPAPDAAEPPPAALPPAEPPPAEPPPAEPPHTAPPGGEPGDGAPPPGPNRRHRQVLVAGIALLVVMVGAAGLAGLLGGTGSPPTPVGRAQPPVLSGAGTGVLGGTGTSRRPSAAPSPTVRRASPAPSPSSVRPSATATAEPAGCTVRWRVDNDWGNGFSASILLRSGTPLTRWTLTFSFPADQRITSGWGGDFNQQGRSVTVYSQDWNSDAGSPLGLSATYQESNPPPRGFDLNGTPCATQ
jgi:eukaryotic-like serine/threonine-protein kinase